MKTALVSLFLFLVLHAQAGGSGQVKLWLTPLKKSPTQLNIQAKPTCLIPRYQLPKASVFCRMEDKLTRVSRVWIKVGVK